MRSIKLPALIIFLSIAAAACGNNHEAEGNSTPIDSTNINGAAPATYGTDSQKSPVYQGGNDTGMRSNNMSREDSIRERNNRR
jgi:hypothetical protein